MKTTVQPLIDKAEIRALIPHAGSMCLLDRVLAWDDRSILCTTETHRDVANPLRRDGCLGAVHAFEYGAQAVAIHGGLRARAAGTVPPPGYLAALRDAALHTSQLDGFSSPLQVHAEQLFADSANSVSQCRISTGDTLLAHGRVTIILRTSAQPAAKDGRRPAANILGFRSAVDRSIPARHPSLPGHFPGEPIVPGVVILDQVIAALQQTQKCPVRLQRIHTVKFHAPLRPEEEFTISFTTSTETPVGFRCRAAERLIAEGQLEVTSHD